MIIRLFIWVLFLGQMVQNSYMLYLLTCYIIMFQVFPYQTDEVGCFKTSLLFVDSIVEMFSAMLHLVLLVVAPRSTSNNPETFVALLEEHRVSRLIMVPSMLRSILFYLTISGGSSRYLLSYKLSRPGQHPYLNTLLT